MSLAVPRTAPVAVLVACALCAAPAHAQDRPDVLVAQIAQTDAAPTPGGQPPLTTEPPVPLGGGGPDPTPTPTATPTPEPTAEASPGPSGGTGEELPATGQESILTALAGVALLGMGLSLRWSLPDAGR